MALSNSDDFYKYLRQFSIKRGQPYTHTSIAKIGSSTGMSLNIPNDRMNEFFEKYTRALMRGVSLHLTEKPVNPSLMRIDLDFRFMPPKILEDVNVNDDTLSVDTGSINSKKADDDNDAEEKIIPRMYKIEHIENILIAYFEILAEFLNVTDDALVAYVMEKPEPVLKTGKIKDGIHVIWPNIVVSNNFQHMIRKKILDQASDIFGGLKVCNTYEDIVDQAIIDKNNWQIYGSRKPDCKSYTVTHVYKYNKYTSTLSTIDNPMPKDEIELVKNFSMRIEREPCIFYTEKEKEYNDYVLHIIPTIDEKRKMKINSQIFGNSINPARALLENTDERELAKRLVMECLSRQRADNYEDWIKLGWTLRNIDYNLIDTWVEFSRLSEKYMEGECQRCWDRMCTDALGMGTLRWWARKDNPQQYEHIINANVLTLIDKCAGSKGAPYDVAEVVYMLYKDKFRHTTKDIWFTFKAEKHRWMRTTKGIILRNLLSTSVCKKFMVRANNWNLEVIKGEQTNLEAQKTGDQLKRITIELKKTAFKGNVMTECECFFTDEKFEDVLDSRPYLIGFENGVYDLRMHEFRDGLPDDYVTYSTGRHYIPYNAKSEEAQEIEKFMNKIFTKPVILKYIKDVFASILDGSIRQEKLYIFNGHGCHAKDTLIMKHDGSFVKVQDILVGDVLMGDDSTPRNVLELFRGEDEMYKIIPIKGEPFVVNENHILCLKFTNLNIVTKRTDGCYKENPRYRAVWYEYPNDHSKEPLRKSKMFPMHEDAEKFLKNIENERIISKGDVLEIKVKDLLQWHPWWLEKGNITLYKTDRVEFEERMVKMDPYMLGVWLCDGSSYHQRITTMNEEIINEVLNALREYNLFQNKHIPEDYKHNSREIRLKLLAGIIDTDGHYQKNVNQYEIIQKNEKLMDDIVYLARSLGFACYKKQIQKTCTNGKNGPVTGTYYRIQIYGNGIENIPCLLPRKKAEPRRKEKNSLLDGFKIERLDKDDYYGFQLDKNHRYLTGDFTVHHNSNGKSVWLNFVQKAIGDYYCILPIALLTQKRTQSNSAQAELERTKGRRVTVMQEPGDGEKLNIGLMKELTGGDRILTRGLFKDPIEFKPQFKMLMTCNELPEVSSDDGGTWRRIRVIEFTSKFTDKPDPKNPNEFKADPELIDKFDRWADTFVSMLIDHHKHNDMTNIYEPEEVTKSTDKYRYDNDSIGQYVSESIILDSDSTDRVKINDIYTGFKAWANQVLNKNRKVPDRTQFKTYMEKVFGPYPKDGRGWKNIRMLNDNDDSEADD